MSDDYQYFTTTSLVPEDKKLSLADCRRILNRDGISYTDLEVLEIRDWLYNIVGIILDADEREKQKNESLKI